MNSFDRSYFRQLSSFQRRTKALIGTKVCWGGEGLPVCLSLADIVALVAAEALTFADLALGAWRGGWDPGYLKHTICSGQLSPLNTGIQEWVFKCMFSLFRGNE